VVSITLRTLVRNLQFFPELKARQVPLSGGIANLLVPLTDEWVIGDGWVLKEDPEGGECGDETHIIHNSMSTTPHDEHWEIAFRSRYCSSYWIQPPKYLLEAANLTVCIYLKSSRPLFWPFF
jgi:hypothetical protein